MNQILNDRERVRKWWREWGGRGGRECGRRKEDERSTPTPASGRLRRVSGHIDGGHEAHLVGVEVPPPEKANGSAELLCCVVLCPLGVRY